MPSGIPVGTLAIGKAGAINAALLAISILSVRYTKIQNKLRVYRDNFEKKVPKRPF
jgi:5-(carboxyamino)imidazole ribonucleotide mutase